MSVLPKLEIAHLELEDITDYYQPGISVEMLSIIKMGNPIMCTLLSHDDPQIEIHVGAIPNYNTHICEHSYGDSCLIIVIRMVSRLSTIGIAICFCSEMADAILEQTNVFTHAIQ